MLLLARYFLDEKATKLELRVPGIPVAAESKLKDYFWPGNVSDLENIMERTVFLSNGGEIGPDDLPAVSRMEAANP